MSRRLKTWFDVDIQVFSYHNPLEFILTCERETYGGLINCYSKFFKNDVQYFSDSNGYWRFGRLYDQIENTQATKLQILTHPEWWQEEAMMPRDRILRCAEGRKDAVMAEYDGFLVKSGRKNIGQ